MKQGKKRVLIFAKFKKKAGMTMRLVELEALENAGLVVTSRNKKFYWIGTQIVRAGKVHTYLSEAHAARDFQRLNKRKVAK